MLGKKKKTKGISPPSLCLVQYEWEAEQDSSVPFALCIFFLFIIIIIFILVTSFFALPCLNQYANADSCFSACRSYCIVSVVQNHSLVLVFEKGYKYHVVSDPD